MRCVCGRTLRPSWREWMWLGMIAVALIGFARAERERREYRTATAELIQLGIEAQGMLDSVRAYPR